MCYETGSMRVDSSFREFNLLGPPRFLTSSPEFRHVSFARTHKKSEPSPPAILRIQIPDPRTPSQTCLTPPFPSQADFAPRSATRESHPAVPAGPRPVDPPRPTPLRSSACARHFSKDGAIAVPRSAPLPSGRVPRPDPRAITHFERARNIREARKKRRRFGSPVAERRHPGARKGDTGGRTAGSGQLAGGRRRKAQSAERHERRGRTLCAMRLAPGDASRRQQVQSKGQGAESRAARAKGVGRYAPGESGSRQLAGGGRRGTKTHSAKRGVLRARAVGRYAPCALRQPQMAAGRRQRARCRAHSEKR